MKKVNVEKVFEDTKEAYSFDRYGEAAWRKSIENLVGLGYTESKIEDIMRSKLTRWAGDSFAPTKVNEDGETEEDWGNFTGNEIVEYHNKYGLHIKRF